MGEDKSKRIFTIFITIFLDLLGFGLIIPILAPLILRNATGLFNSSSSFGTRTLILGLLMASFSFAQFFSSPILGSLSDRIGRKKVLVYSLFITIFGYIVLTAGIQLNSLLLVFLGRIIPGLGTGNITIAYSAIADISTPEEKTKNFGIVGIAFGLGFVIGPFAGGELSNNQLVSWFSYETPFIAATILSVFNLILVFRYFKETLKERKDGVISLLTGARNIKKAFTNESLRSIFTITFIYVFGFTFFTQFLLVILVQKFNFHQSEIGMLYGYLGLCVAIAQGLIIRPLSKKFKPAIIPLFTIPLMAVSLISILIPDKGGYLYLIIPFIAFAQSSSNSSMTAVVSNMANPQIQGEILGITISMNFLAQGIPALIGGIVVAGHIYIPIILSSFCAFLAWILYIRFYRLKHHENLI